MTDFYTLCCPKSIFPQVVFIYPPVVTEKFSFHFPFRAEKCYSVANLFLTGITCRPVVWPWVPDALHARFQSRLDLWSGSAKCARFFFQWCATCFHSVGILQFVPFTIWGKKYAQCNKAIVLNLAVRGQTMFMQACLNHSLVHLFWESGHANVKLSESSS